MIGYLFLSAFYSKDLIMEFLYISIGMFLILMILISYLIIYFLWFTYKYIKWEKINKFFYGIIGNYKNNLWIFIKLITFFYLEGIYLH